MILARKFTLAEDNDYEHLAAASGRLLALQEAFSAGHLPPEYGLKQLAGYARSLLDVQRDDGSFASYSHPEKLEDDVRTDAHRFVTWAALAFLCCFEDFRRKSGKGKNSEESEFGVLPEDLSKGISAALRCPVSSDFSFPESGEAEAVQQVEAVLILSSGGIPGRLRIGLNPAPELIAALNGISEDFRNRLDTGNTRIAGGIEYEFLFRQALEGLES